MNRKPLVSVCMPLYNTEAYLAEAVEGVLRQTYKHFELIICDNNSTDRSFEIAQAYAKKDKRVRVVRNLQNLGYAGNLHKVTSLAQGDFMIVHCADDLSEPTALQRLMEIASRPDVSPDKTIFLSDAFVVDSAGHRTHALTRAPKGFANKDITITDYTASGRLDRFSGREAFADALTQLRTVGWLGAIMYSRQLFNSIEGVYNGRLYNPDKHYMYKLLSQDPEVVWLHEPLFSWRIHGTNQEAQQRAAGALKQAVDDYIYTFEYSARFLQERGVNRENMIRSYVDRILLRKSLAEIKDGSILLAFRHLCFALATYPRATVRNLKFYVALLGCLTGPVGRLLARAGYSLGFWRIRS